MSIQAAVLEALDAATTRSVLVVGSLPPDGRDLDILARPPDDAALRAELERLGAVRRGRDLALFAGRTAYAVDVLTPDRWALPDAEVEALFAAARPLDGYRNIVRPAPEHSVLVLARIGLTPKRRPRLEAAIAEDPAAVAAAEARAAAWGVDVAALQRARLRPRARPQRHVRAAHVVALSGLDGSGKSTQARALEAALAALGYDAHVEWAPILQANAVARASGVARKVLRVVRPRSSAAIEATGASLVAGRSDPAARQRALRAAWTTYVTAINATSLARAAVVHRGRDTVIVFDRFVLDSVVRLRFLYGRDDSFLFQRALLRAVAPDPVASYWLAVPPERAYERKPEHWNVEQLGAQHSLYEDEHERLGVRRLDGERPPDELAAEIAADVWRRL